MTCRNSGRLRAETTEGFTELCDSKRGSGYNLRCMNSQAHDQPVRLMFQFRDSNLHSF
jgi:hypothetical protein